MDSVFFLLRARGYSNSEYKHHFCAELSHCFSIILKQLITSVSVTSGAWCISSTHHLLFRLSSIIPMKFCLLVYFCFLFCLFFFYRLSHQLSIGLISSWGGLRKFCPILTNFKQERLKRQQLTVSYRQRYVV